MMTKRLTKSIPAISEKPVRQFAGKATGHQLKKFPADEAEEFQ
jgi:hypothetical protein